MATVTQFLSSIGVNTHMDATDTPYGNVATVAKDLAYLGVTHIRDHAWDVDLPAYQTLAAKGVKFDLIVDANAKNLVTSMIPIKSSIVSFEGANEVDIQPVAVPGVHGNVASALAEQKALYAAVKGNSALSAIPVINESIGDPNNYASYVGTVAYSDMINMHAYAAWGDAPRYVLPQRMATEGSTTKPSIITETGYFTMLNNTVDPSGVTESVQARFTLDTLFDDFAMGVTQTYLYELLDEGNDPAGTNSELHYGLFHADGTPKLAATAIHNLGAILSTPGSGANPAVSLTPSFTNLPDTGRSMQLAGADGAAFLAVWAEPQVWNTNAQTEMPVTTTPVTVDLGKTIASVSVFDPMVGSKAIATYANISKLVLNITDHPLIIEASGAGSVPVTPIPAAAIGPSGDAAITPAGSTIVDAANAAVLVGDPYTDAAFFVHTAGQRSTSSAIVNFHGGDTLTLWGFVDGVSTMSWKSNQTTNGFTGMTLRAQLAGTSKGPTATITLAGLSMHDVRANVQVTTGTSNGASYLRLTDVG